jgi:hypothetical protein
VLGWLERSPNGGADAEPNTQAYSSLSLLQGSAERYDSEPVSMMCLSVSRFPEISESIFRDPASHLIGHGEMPSGALQVLLAERVGVCSRGISK